MFLDKYGASFTYVTYLQIEIFYDDERFLNGHVICSSDDQIGHLARH